MPETPYPIHTVLEVTSASWVSQSGDLSFCRVLGHGYEPGGSIRYHVEDCETGKEGWIGETVVVRTLTGPVSTALLDVLDYLGED